MPVFDSLIDTIGRTPVIHITRFDPTGRLFAKTEGRNPGGSAKDRPALYMIRDAMARGVLREGGAMVEPTSGNTGVGLAWIAAVMGLKLVLTMPETMSVERRADSAHPRRGGHGGRYQARGGDCRPNGRFHAHAV